MWICSSGVLLLNAVLTVRAHNANSHKDRGWEKFTDAVVQWMNRNLDGVVFMLWGSYAQKKGAAINRVSVHMVHIDISEPFIVFVLSCLCLFCLPEAPSCPADGASFTAFCSSRIFRMWAFFEGQRAAKEIWEVTCGLEGTLSAISVSTDHR